MKRDPQAKIKTIDELASILEKSRKEGKKIAHCHGCFDLLHPGHLKHFQAARNKGDVLVVTLTKDEYVNKGPGRPVFNHHLRAESIAALECVDYVAINEWPTAIETIKLLKPHFYVKGSDYADKSSDLSGKIYEEEEAVKSVGGMLHFTDEVSFSSSSLINTFLSPYPQEAKDFFHEFKKKYSASDIIKRIKSVEELKVLVIGDIIIDEYHYCSGMGKSAKDNIIATKFINDEVFAGGVLAAANHIAGFCKDVTLLSCIGQVNNYDDFITSHLKTNITPNLYYRKDVPTVVKRRFVDPAFLTKLFEICYLDDISPMPKDVEAEIIDYLQKSLKDFDLVLVTDFGHGLITPKIIKLLSESAKFLAVNVQTNSANLGFNLITKIHRADFICIDEPEMRLACHDKISNLEHLIADVSKKVNCEKIIVTRGHKGSLVYSPKDGFSEIPVFSRDIVDRIGAGDAFFSIAAPCVYKDNPMQVAGFIGNAVGAMKVLIVGNRSAVEPLPLFKYITTLLK
ncbi:MAG: adenylyltransferase/cytidyltransferase family protein [Candidatus Omnitrophica bacterium]|nr:adenylyltransferase/cytidyltransferase family protein [Candidatus Omnitrophota bacterium]MBU1922886.1 adenylyltransferase/cytidyltransferase family protein [Candidatus Omnitrophota bacterium]